MQLYLMSGHRYMYMYTSQLPYDTKHCTYRGMLVYTASGHRYIV